MIQLTASFRGTDSFGSGSFGSARGKRTHRGVDFLATATNVVHSGFKGRITKLGSCYSDTPNYRYVQVTDESGFNYRYFYVKPSVVLGDEVEIGDEIGFVQDLTLRYRGIPNHIHFEVKDINGEYLNPMHVLLNADL